MTAAALPVHTRRQLLDDGFVVVGGWMPEDAVAPLSASYDVAVRAADPSDVRVGSTTTRISDFVNRGAEFDALYLEPALLDACAVVIGGPFKLSTMHASMILFNGSIWHGHTAHRSAETRRSIQGAFIRRDAASGANLPARMRPETLARLSPLAKHLLAI